MQTESAPLVRVKDLRKEFNAGGTFFNRRHVCALDGISFDIGKGETLGLVGESGSGKSTLGRVVIGLTSPTSGSSTVAGIDVRGLRGRLRGRLWRRAQMVFQDPYSSLNPRMTIRDSLAEPLRNYRIASGAQADVLIRKALDACGLNAGVMDRYPREFSGGQRQRVGIARALITRPDFIVADEPVSALDVSVQAQIVNLMQDLRLEFGLTYLFIAHDLAIVRHVASRVAVMYCGKVVEIGPVDDVYDTPRHPYTQLLLSSVPFAEVTRERERLRALVRTPGPETQASSTGCSFARRCPWAQAVCTEIQPFLAPDRNGHAAACHFAEAAQTAAAPPAAAWSQSPVPLEERR